MADDDQVKGHRREHFQSVRNLGGGDHDVACLFEGGTPACRDDFVEGETQVCPFHSGFLSAVGPIPGHATRARLTFSAREGAQIFFSAPASTSKLTASCSMMSARDTIPTTLPCSSTTGRRRTWCSAM